MQRLLPFILLVVVVFGVYTPNLRNGFVWDDQALVLRDSGRDSSIFTDATASDFHRPIQRLTCPLEYAGFGFAPAAHHVTSVLCHQSSWSRIPLFRA
ncbi:MAG: hypothetical protein M3505_02685 [Verrucomicrobiota bacterium]|nr:hypothetical protein [Verrucomicrobiota bacterium]